MQFKEDSYGMLKVGEIDQSRRAKPYHFIQWTEKITQVIAGLTWLRPYLRLVTH